jgi:hypothetical protein
MPTRKSSDQCFIPLYMCLCWNLFARSCTVTILRLSQMEWEGDSLIVYIVGHRAGQTGEHVIPIHIYANPSKPWVCPLTALGLYLFGIHFRPDNSSLDSLFTGNSYETFTKFLVDALHILQGLSKDPADFGTQSFRLGVATYVAGFIGGPSIVPILLRASGGKANDAAYVLASCMCYY